MEFDRLIEALTIFKKYADPPDGLPTHCEHDVLMIGSVDPTTVSDEDMKRLEELSFVVSEEDDGFRSYWFGSC